MYGVPCHMLGCTHFAYVYVCSICCSLHIRGMHTSATYAIVNTSEVCRLWGGCTPHYKSTFCKSFALKGVGLYSELVTLCISASSEQPRWLNSLCAIAIHLFTSCGKLVLNVANLASCNKLRLGQIFLKFQVLSYPTIQISRIVSVA